MHPVCTKPLYYFMLSLFIVRECKILLINLWISLLLMFLRAAICFLVCFGLSCSPEPYLSSYSRLTSWIVVEVKLSGLTYLSSCRTFLCLWGVPVRSVLSSLLQFQYIWRDLADSLSWDHSRSCFHRTCQHKCDCSLFQGRASVWSATVLLRSLLRHISCVHPYGAWRSSVRLTFGSFTLKGSYLLLSKNPSLKTHHFSSIATLIVSSNIGFIFKIYTLNDRK